MISHYTPVTKQYILEHRVVFRGAFGGLHSAQAGRPAGQAGPGN